MKYTKEQDFKYGTIVIIIGIIVFFTGLWGGAYLVSLFPKDSPFSFATFVTAFVISILGFLLSVLGFCGILSGLYKD